MYHGDCSQILPTIPEESVDLIVTSPPYNVGKDYGIYKDNMSFTDYYKWTEQWMTECYRINKIGGRICINIPLIAHRDYDNNKEIITYIDKFITILKRIGYILRDTIIWVKASDDEANIFCGNNTAWGSWISPSNPFCRSFTEFIIVAHKKEAKIQHTGITDLTKKEFMLYSRNIWAMRTSLEEEHAAPYPEELPYRCIKFYSYIGDTVLDPFLGSGTTMKVARLLKRDCIGIELNPKYIELAKNRVNFGSTLEDVKFEFKEFTPLVTSLG